MADGPVLVERLEQGVAKLTLNNPPLNLVTLEMTERLIEALDELEREDAVHAVVVTGTGEKAFCAGSDVKEFADVRDRVVEKKLARENEAFGRFETLSKPVIVAIEGLAYGGGCEISMACDLRITGQGAKFALPEVRLGVVPGSGGLFRLPSSSAPPKRWSSCISANPSTCARQSASAWSTKSSQMGRRWCVPSKSPGASPASRRRLWRRSNAP